MSTETVHETASDKELAQQTEETVAETEESASEEKDIRLRVRQDRMAVLADLDFSNENLTSMCKRILESLTEIKVESKPDLETLEAKIKSAAQNKTTIEGLCVSEGTPMVPPQDAKLEWAQDFFTEGFAKDEITGAVDYRRHAEHLSVTEGEHLATITPAVPGTDGKDVFGKRVASPKPRRPRVRVGPNVEHDEENSSYSATAAGRIRWLNEMLSVDKIFTVEGSIGLKTGHISHPGALIVERDIEEGSEVVAAGDIEVRGVVEPSTIRAGGDITVAGGITGQEGYEITAGGSVRAKFILDAHVKAGESVIVEREIVHSIVKSRGSIRVEQGRIVGGEVTGLAGIAVGEAGSDAVVPTSLISGEDHTFEERFRPEQEAVERLDENISKIRSTVNPLLTRLERFGKDKQTAIEKLVDTAKKMEASRQVHQEKIDALRADSKDRAKHVIKIGKAVFPETVLRVRGDKLTTKETHKGPLKVVFLKGRVRLRGSQATKTAE